MPPFHAIQVSVHFGPRGGCHQEELPAVEADSRLVVKEPQPDPIATIGPRTPLTYVSAVP